MITYRAAILPRLHCAVSRINHVSYQEFVTHSKPGGTVTEICWSVYQTLFSRPNIKEKSSLASKTGILIGVQYPPDIAEAISSMISL